MYLEEDGNGELGDVAALEEIAERVLHLLGNAAGLQDLVELGLDVVGAADLSENRLAFLQAAALDETVWGVDHEECAGCEEDRRYAGERERQPPSPWVDSESPRQGRVRKLAKCMMRSLL